MKKPILLAHRGFSGTYPENSPLAFEMAVEKTDADGFESDVHITKDGKLVIFHDATLERTSNGTGCIKDHTYEELLALDIGAWKSPEFAGQHIWTFDQLLEFCRETKKLLNMELKNYEVFYEGLEQRVIDAVCAHQMQDQVFVSSFNHISMRASKSCAQRLRRVCCMTSPIWIWPAMWSGPTRTTCTPLYAAAVSAGADGAVSWPGHGVNTWTVNDEENMRDMMARGVDAIISNYPDLLCRVAGEVYG